MKTNCLLLVVISSLCFLTSCREPATHVTYSTWSPRGLWRLPVEGGTPQLLVDGASSEVAVIDMSTETLFTASEQSVERRTLDGVRVGGFMPPKHMRAMAVDAAHGHLYLAEEKNSHDIVRTDLDGGNLKVIVPDARHCHALAFDGKNQKLYWSREHPSGVFRANADGTDIQQVAKETLIPQAVAVDEIHGLLFWACSDFSGNTSHITRAKLDGSGASSILTLRGHYIEALASDPATQRLFWIERTGGGQATIQSALHDGSGMKTLLTFEKNNWARCLTLGRLPKVAKQ